ncbi:hypothetical protein GGS20DRAFT_530271 [Poronia punctata]|nr:hypothetical protein GGS20DRAFT_530271 [Poronia punctata]
MLFIGLVGNVFYFHTTRAIPRTSSSSSVRINTSRYSYAFKPTTIHFFFWDGTCAVGPTSPNLLRYEFPSFSDDRKSDPFPTHLGGILDATSLLLRSGAESGRACCRWKMIIFVLLL